MSPSLRRFLCEWTDRHVARLGKALLCEGGTDGEGTPPPWAPAGLCGLWLGTAG